MKKVYLALTMLLFVLSSTLWVEKASAAKVVFVAIHNTEDWTKFRDEVARAKGQYWVDARLEADITVDGTIGWTEDAPFRGTFDGNGHTMNVNISGDVHNVRAVAPFRYVGDATIKDLHITGNVTGAIHAAGLIGQCVNGSPTVTLNRVWVSTNVTSTDTHAGGIIGHSVKAIVNMNDCLFDGTITTNNSGNSYIGCIIGWCDGGGWAMHRIYNCPSEVPKAYRIYFCVDYDHTPWGGNSKSSLTITSTTWDDWRVTYYNKTDQNEVMNLMNAEQPGSWQNVNGKAVPVMSQVLAVSGWTMLSGGSYYGFTLNSGRYYVTNNVTFDNGDTESGLTIADGATVHLYIPKGITLTAKGGNASGRNGAGAGILLPEGSTLYLEGGGTVNATGGKAANGGDGDIGGDAWYSSESDKGYTGSGGNGGFGGGGAGAGIGTCGGDGGAGGTGPGGFSDNNNRNGTSGGAGNSGSTALSMGKLYVDQTSGLTVNATGGKAGDREGRGGNGGNSRIEHRGEVYYVFAMAGGGGGGGGGLGGAASDIGTGGPGGGGGGGGSNGAMSIKYTGYYSAYANGGKGGENATKGNASAGGDTGADPDYYSAGKCTSNKGSGYVKSSCHHDGGGSRGSAGDGGSCGNASQSRGLHYEYLLRYHARDSFRGSDVLTVTTGYKANVSGGSVNLSIPTFYELGLLRQGRYLLEWKTNSDGTGTAYGVGDVCAVSGVKDLYAEWKDYKDLFPEGVGSQSKPFIIKGAQLAVLTDYVNRGGNTRGVCFKQQDDIILQNDMTDGLLTPIGHTRSFQGDYDGGGYRIRNGQIDAGGKDLSAIGIFGKVAGAVHNLGVEDVTLGWPAYQDARCGLVAGRLVNEALFVNGVMEKPAGMIRNCYSAKNTITANYGGCLVGEMADGTTMSHCHEFRNALQGARAASLSSQIHSSATVDRCFSTGTSASADGYKNETNSKFRADGELASGEAAWLLNDQSPFDVTWYQNLKEDGLRDACPVLNNASARVYHKDNIYSNEPMGALFDLSGRGLKDDPFLIGSLADLRKVAEYCNNGSRSKGIHFRQTADIDLGSVEWTPVGDIQSRAFDGYYDGGGHAVRNGQIQADAYAGVFGVVAGTVNRLCVENTTVKYLKRDGRAGAVAGRITGNGVVSNCFVKGCRVSNNEHGTADEKIGVAGGIAADMKGGGVVRGCLVVQTLMTASRTGAVCSDADRGTQMQWCYTDADALTSSDARATVTDCFPGQTAAILRDGSVAYGLNRGDNPDPAWFQNISIGSKRDDTPVLSGDHGMVFKIGGTYTNDGEQLGRLGKGTAEDPYKIGTPDDLKKLVVSIGTMKRSNFYVRQTADIDMKDSLMYPIGTGTRGFEGHYDGAGHVVKNVRMSNHQGEWMGLFNNILGTVERLGIEGGTFAAEGDATRVGAFAGRMSGQGCLRNCYVKDSKIDFRNSPGVVVGALVGEQTDTSRIVACYGYRNTVVGQDNGQRHYGHIVGYMGSHAADSLVFTDGDALCADYQGGAQNIVRSEAAVADLRFRCGEVCYLLSGSKDNGRTWGQTIRKDLTPVPSTNGHLPVFRHALDYQVLYSNTNDVPYTVSLALNPNHNGIGSKTVEVFRADTALLVPPFSLKPHAVSWLNHDFMGWNTQADGRGRFYAYDAELMPEGPVTLYAVWGLKVPANTTGGKARVERLEEGGCAICDDGGSRGPYGYGYNGKLTLKAAAARSIIGLVGSLSTEAPGSDGRPRDYMVVYDGDETKTVRLANERGDNVFYSRVNGDRQDIGLLLSTGSEMTIEFVTDGENCYDGLELRAYVLPKEILDLAGNGSEEWPFLVKSMKDLMTLDRYIRLTRDSKIHVRQVADIDMDYEDFSPMAASVTSFEGHYDGGGHEIRHMNMVSDQNGPVGLFSSVSGTVERLGIVNSTYTGEQTDTLVGVFAGRLTGQGRLLGCYARGNTVCYNGKKCRTGALVGELADTARLAACYAYGNAGCDSVAGLTSGMATQSLVFTDKAGVTAERFASGEVCYLLNGCTSDSVVWRQTLKTDSLPVLCDTHGVVYTYLLNEQPAYSNTAVSNAQYHISSKSDFVAFAGKPDADIYLTQDIDLGEWYDILKLNGNFDGGGHTITYSSHYDCSGLFDIVNQGASLKHLRVRASVRTKGDCGGIVRKNNGTISDCHFLGDINGYQGFLWLKHCDIAGIAARVGDNSVIDHCSATGHLSAVAAGQAYHICPDMDKTVSCTWIDPADQSEYAAHRKTAQEAQADYPVYAQGILDAVGPEVIAGSDTLSAPGKHLAKLTITDGQRFKCPAEVTVDQITYKRRGTNGAYEPWVLPFDHTIDAAMLMAEAPEFYCFDKDSTGQIVTRRISSDAPYQVAANEPLAFRSPGGDELAFEMKLVKDGSSQPMTIKMPLGGEAASMSSTKDMARVMVTYDTIPADRTVKELMYVWRDSVGDFVLGDGQTALQPFRYYLQYVDKATGHLEQYEQTDWARQEARRKSSGSTQQPIARRKEARRASLAEMTAQGWQAVFPHEKEMEITENLLDKYEILTLYDLYDQKATAADGQNRMAVTVVYVPVEAGTTLPLAAPLLVRAKDADTEPLVTEEMGRELDTALKWIGEQDEDELQEIYGEMHYWCSTFNGRYDIWQFPIPESDNVMNELGALVFADKGDDQYFYRLPASDGYSMKPMSYCFTAYDARTFENLPLANDRIEIVVLDILSDDPTGIETVYANTAQDGNRQGEQYNLQGQKVGDGYRGIIINNGRKVVKR